MNPVQLEKEDEDDEFTFEQIVEEDPGVCDNCFRRTHQVEENWHPDQELLLEREPVEGEWHEMAPEEREKKFSYRRFHPIEENVEKVYPGRKEPKGAPKGRNVCVSCGIIDRGVKIRPVSKEEAIEYTKNLSDRLEEKGIGFDKDTLFDCVRHLKSRPDHQSADDDIFAASVEVAIQYSE